MMKNKIDSTIGINFDTSKITKELGKLEDKLGDVSQASIEAEKSAQQYKLQQEKIRSELALGKKAIDERVQALKTEASLAKSTAETFKASASDRKTAATINQTAVRDLQQQTLATKNALRKTTLEQAKSQKALERILKEKDIDYKREALAVRASNLKIRQELIKTRNENKKAAGGFGFLGQAIAAIGVGTAAKGFIELADRAQFLENRIKVSTSSVQEMNTTLDDLRQISRETGSSLENNAILFQRLAIASEALGGTNKDMLALTKTVANLGRLSGSSTEDMKNATRQLSQALGSTKLQAEEFNSVIDQMPELVSVVAKEMGYTSAEFGIAVRTGKILSKDVYDALIKKGDEVNKRAAQLPLTFGQASQVLTNELIAALGDINKQLGVTKTLAGAMETLADNSALLTNIIKGTIVAVGTLTAAWIAYTVAVTAADLRTKAFALNFGPAGWIAVAASVFAAASLSVAVFGDNAEEATVDVAELADRLRKAKNEAQALAAQSGYIKQIQKLGREYDELLAKKKDLEAQPQTGTLAGNQGRRKTQAAKDLDVINAKMKEAEKQMMAVNDLVALAGDKADVFSSKEDAVNLSDAAKKEAKKYETIKKSLEAERAGALRVFEEKNSYIQRYEANDKKARDNLVAANANEFNAKIQDILKQEGAEEEARRKKYTDLEDSFKSERQLLLEDREKKRELIEEFAVGDDKKGKLQKLRDDYAEELAIIEKNDQAKQDARTASNEAEIAAERAKLGVGGAFLNQEAAIRKKHGKDKLGYAASLGKALLSDADKSNRAMFEANKAYNLAEAIVLGWKSIQAAYASAPGPAGWALAAITAAKVAIQVNGIKNTKFGGGGGSPSASGGGGSGGGATETAPTAAAPPPLQQNQSITIAVDAGVVDDDGLYTGKAIRRITEEIAKQIEEGVTNVRWAV